MSRIEQDKDRLNSQLNQMITNYQQLEASHTTLM